MLEQLRGTCVVRWRFLQTHTQTKTRYGILNTEKSDERFRILALRDGRVVGLYDLDTAVDPMLSQTMGMNQSRDEILIEEKKI